MSEESEPCDCRFCLATEQVVSDAEPAWGGMATTYLIARNMNEVDPERTPLSVMMHLTSMKRQFFRSGQLDLKFAIADVVSRAPRPKRPNGLRPFGRGISQSLSVDIYWRFAPPPMVKSAGKGL